MNWRKIGHICAIIYLFLYLAAMVMPRKLPNGQSSTHVFSFKRIFHEILYYGGPLEPIANFFFLTPIFAALIILVGRTKALLALSICIGLAASAEILQRYIPGRVSSFKDFALNSAGALVAYLLYKFRTRKRGRV
jgi:glycopeptide antibiotics resistance protein